MLEAHEAIPSALSQPAPIHKSRGLRRVHAEHHASMVIDSLRVPFTLDIPSDASPCFRVGIEDSDYPPDGGLDWKVRMTFLVAMGGEDGSGTRHLLRDGAGGEWGNSWKATPSLAPLSRGAGVVGAGGVYYRPSTATTSSTGSAWSLFSTRSTDATPTGEPAGDWDWREATTETVECEVGITVWPGNTLYKPAQCDFEV
jgi:RAB6A-GEF complex partner protein 2